MHDPRETRENNAYPRGYSFYAANGYRPLFPAIKRGNLERIQQLNDKVSSEATLFKKNVDRYIDVEKNSKDGYNLHQSLRQISQYLVWVGTKNCNVLDKQTAITTFETLNQMVVGQGNHDAISMMDTIYPVSKMIGGAICLGVGALIFGLSLAAVLLPVIPTLLWIVGLFVSFPLMTGGMLLLCRGVREQSFSNNIARFRDYVQNPQVDYESQSDVLARLKL